MLVTKTNPVGIDVVIQKFQTALHTKLLAKWGIDTADYKCYGRCYRNKTDNGYIAENYTGENDKYEEVYWDSKLKAISFFGIGSTIERKVNDTTDVHLVFFVDLKKLKPSINHRADEEVRNDVLQLFNIGMYGLNFTGVELYLENVLKEYPGSRREKRLAAVDMHPSHCFRLNFTAIYNKNIC